MTTLLLVAAVVSSLVGSDAQSPRPDRQVIVLWPEGVPNAKPNGGTERVEDDRVYNVQNPTLTIVPPETRPNGTAVVVCAGGSYMRLAIANEFSEIAERIDEPELLVLGLQWRLYDTLELADIDAAYRWPERLRALADELGQPIYRYRAARWNVIWAMIGDRLAEVPDLIAQAHELGEVGGKDGAHAPGVRTDPAEAAAFVDATGVDSLAVAVGTSHAMADRSAIVDLGLVRALFAAVPVPLVLHGSSGVDDDGLVQAVRAGMTKVNIATRLNQVMTGVVRGVLAADDRVSDPRKYLGPARAAVADEVTLLLRLLHG